jgi:hypothetical protein
VTREHEGTHKVCERCGVGYYGERACPFCAVVELTQTGHVIGATYRSSYLLYEYRVLSEPSPGVVEVERVSEGGAGSRRQGEVWTHRSSRGKDRLLDGPSAEAERERISAELRMVEAARRWLRRNGDGDQVDLASPAEVVEMLEGFYPGGSAGFRADAERGPFQRDGRWQIHRQAFERLKLHGYAGTKGGESWAVAWTDRGTTLFPDVEVIA